MLHRVSQQLFQCIKECYLQGANQAAAAASLGYPTYFLGQVRIASSVQLACSHTDHAV